MIRTLLIDNYDSFTFNLHHFLAEVNGTPPVVVANDWGDWNVDVLDRFDNVVISPGPGSPDRAEDFGICGEAITSARIPVLGICLGHQGIALAHGGSVAHAPAPRHGRLSEIRNLGVDLFTDLPPTFNAVRYHSLAVTDVPEALEVTAYSDDGVIMGLRHRTLPQWGVQFHPESISTEHSLQLLGNFARLTREWAGGETESSTTGTLNSGSPSSSTASSGTPGGRTAHGWSDDSTSDTPGLRPEPVTVALQVEALDLSAPIGAIFAALYGDEEEAVWLDGNDPSSESSRFTIMGAPTGPNGRVATADTDTRTIRIRHTGRAPAGTETICSGFFDWLEAELDSVEIEAPPLPFDFRLGWVGYLGYELKSEVGSPNQHHSDLPDASLMFLDRAVVIDHEESKAYLLALNGLGSSPTDCETWCAQTRTAIQELAAASSTSTGGLPPGAASHTDALTVTSMAARHSRNQYRDNIARVLEKITDGETYEVCLTNMLEAEGEIDSLSAYPSLRAQNPTPFGVYLVSKDATILSTSPERFLRIGSDGRVESKPIKGTRARGRTDDEDHAIKEELRHSEKDRSENLMIVDLVRHDLGTTAEFGSVCVDVLFGIETYATVHQMVSTVSAVLDSEHSPVACVRAAFPPGSMTGAPKLRTMSIIDELETGPRGVYSGAIGYFSLNGAVDLSVVIRTLVVADDTVRYGVGGAIVALSDPEDEYAETVAKAAPLLRLFDDAAFPGAVEDTLLGQETLFGRESSDTELEAEETTGREGLVT